MKCARFYYYILSIIFFRIFKVFMICRVGRMGREWAQNWMTMSKLYDWYFQLQSVTDIGISYLSQFKKMAYLISDNSDFQTTDAGETATGEVR